jgi:hypothetical protein
MPTVTVCGSAAARGRRRLSDQVGPTGRQEARSPSPRARERREARSGARPGRGRASGRAPCAAPGGRPACRRWLSAARGQEGDGASLRTVERPWGATARRVPRIASAWGASQRARSGRRCRDPGRFRGRAGARIWGSSGASGRRRRVPGATPAAVQGCERPHRRRAPGPGRGLPAASAARTFLGADRVPSTSNRAMILLAILASARCWGGCCCGLVCCCGGYRGCKGAVSYLKWALSCFAPEPAPMPALPAEWQHSARPARL